MAGEQRQQVARRRHVGVVHDRVVEHHADRPAAGDLGRQALADLRLGQRGAPPLGEPVDVHGHLGEPVDAEGLRARLARQHAEAERGQALRGGSCAAVPRRREDRRDRVAEQVLQATPAGLDVAPLLGRRACRPELLLAALGLVVGVVVAVLVQPEAPGGGVAGAQLARERRVQRGRDDRDVEREPRAVEVVEQLEQALVAPPGVVVAEEEHDRLGRGVEALARRVEPRPGHARDANPPACSLGDRPAMW